MKTIAIITARGGSKRIPRKNMKEFCGKPILVYSIEAALGSGVFDKVMVSTDSLEIASTAKKYGAEVPFFRSAETADDYSTTSDVLLEVLGEYQRKGEFFDIGCCIYPTAPFVTGEKLKKAMEMFKDSARDALIPVTRFSYPPQRAMILEDDGLVFQYPEHLNSRSQDLKPWYHDAGQFYMFRTDTFLRTKKIMGGNVMPLIVSELEVQDIDDMTDWKIAEMKYRMMLESGGREK